MTEIGGKQNQLRQLQLTENEMLKDVVKVCEQYGITYYLSSGTLLGAIRHKGFIPWDDDIDIEIPVNDYRRFLEIAQKALGAQYFVQNYMTDPNFNLAYTRIRKNGTTFLDPYHAAYRIHHGVWLDVFPLVAVNPGLSLSFKRKILSLSNFIQIQGKIDSHMEEFNKLLGPIGMAVMRTFSKLPMKTRQKIHERLLGIVFDADPAKCTHRANVWGNITTVFPKEVYEGTPDSVEFEGEQRSAPHESVKYLEIKYGDYMKLPPVEQRRGHGANIIVDLKNSYEKYIAK